MRGLEEFRVSISLVEEGMALLTPYGIAASAGVLALNFPRKRRE